MADVLVTVTDKRQGEPSGLALPKSSSSSSGSDGELVRPWRRGILQWQSYICWMNVLTDTFCLGQNGGYSN